MGTGWGGGEARSAGIVGVGGGESCGVVWKVGKVAGGGEWWASFLGSAHPGVSLQCGNSVGGKQTRGKQTLTHTAASRDTHLALGSVKPGNGHLFIWEMDRDQLPSSKFQGACEKPMR